MAALTRSSPWPTRRRPDRPAERDNPPGHDAVGRSGGLSAVVGPRGTPTFNRVDRAARPPTRTRRSRAIRGCSVVFTRRRRRAGGHLTRGDPRSPRSHDHPHGRCQARSHILSLLGFGYSLGGDGSLNDRVVITHTTVRLRVHRWRCTRGPCHRRCSTPDYPAPSRDRCLYLRPRRCKASPLLQPQA